MLSFALPFMALYLAGFFATMISFMTNGFRWDKGDEPLYPKLSIVIASIAWPYTFVCAYRNMLRDKGNGGI